MITNPKIAHNRVFELSRDYQPSPRILNRSKLIAEGLKRTPRPKPSIFIKIKNLMGIR